MVDLMLQAACLASPVTFWKHFTLCCPGLYSVQVWLVYKCLALQMSSILIGLSTFLRRPHCEHIGHFWMCPTWRKWPIAKSWQSAYTLCKKIEMLWQWRQSRSFWAQMFQLEFQYLQWCLPHENRICSLAAEPRFNMLQLLENGIESEQKHEQLLYFSWAINSRNDFVYSGPYSTEQSAAKWSSHWSLLGKTDSSE